MKSWRSLLAALILAPLSLARAQSDAFSADTMSERIESAAQWVNNAMAAPTSRAYSGIYAQVLPMDVANYKDFVRLAYHEDVDPELGEYALSAFFQAGARMDARVQDICFLLYNPRAKTILDSEFVTPYARQFGENMTPYIFLAAHEMGHCLEFQHFPGAPDARGRSKLQLEVSADSFALLLLRKAGVPEEQLRTIVASRARQPTTHATMRWIQPAFTAPLPLSSTRLIEDLWIMADKISAGAP